MTWRAFILGLALVAFMCWADVWAGLSRGYGWTTEGHFSPATVFLLVVLVLVVNVTIKLIRRRSGLRQAELMLIWCMITVAAVFPTTGLFRLWLPVLGGPAYFAGRGDVAWKTTSLARAPDPLLLSKNPSSFAVRQFYEGGGEEARIPWQQWLVPISRWLILLSCFYLAIYFMCAILRKQWVEREHLLFPLARVPLDFTAGSGGERLLPAVCYTRAFLYGFCGGGAFRLFRALPVLLGGTQVWNVNVPMADVLRDTPLSAMNFANLSLGWSTIGLAYLVPADVSLSVWLFYLFGRVELQTSAWVGSTLHYGGSWSELLRWQMTGSYFAFTIGALYMTRRHLSDVLRKAFGVGKDVDDSREPVPFAVAFWGLLICTLGAMIWTAYYSKAILVSVCLILVLMCIQFVHARIVSESGLYQTWLLWNPPTVIHSLSMGYALQPLAAVVMYMQHGIMMHNVSLGPAAMHAFRISDVFEKGRKLLLPAMVSATALAIFVCTWTFLSEANMRGVLNLQDTWGNLNNPQGVFQTAHQVIRRPFQMAQPRWIPLGLGVGLTSVTLLMRARFYWWPIHSIGLLAIGNWSADRMWLPFLIGWGIKLSLMKFSGGRAVRQTRLFFIGLILAEATLTAFSTILGALTDGAIGRW